MAVIAPFWATTDTYHAFRAGHSRVYYHVYQQGKENSAEMLTMATKHVQCYNEKFANFEATWVLVVTWEKICPYVYYRYYYYYNYDETFQLNCPWVSVFMPTQLLFLLVMYVYVETSDSIDQRLL